MGYPETVNDTVVYGEKNYYVDSDTFVGMLDGSTLDIWGDVKVNGSPIASTGINVKDYGAKGDGVTNDTVSIQTAINTAAITGGTVIFPSGKFLITDTLVMKNDVSLQGQWPVYHSALATMKGTWLIWGGGAVTKTMIQIGHKDQTTDVHSVNIDQIGVHGSTQSGITGMSIGSNTRTNPVWITTSVSIRRCIIDRCDVGLQWGSGETAEQSDFITLSNVDFYNCISTGLRVNSTNSDFCTVDTCRFIAAGDPYVDLVLHGVMTFRNCAGGGNSTSTKGFIRRTNGNRLTLVSCQSEGCSYFLRTVGVFDLIHPVKLEDCHVDDPIEVTGTHAIVSVNSKFSDRVEFSGVAGRWHGFNDYFQPSLGARFIDSGSSTTFYNLRSQPDTPYTTYFAGDEVILSVPSVHSAPHKRICARSGRNAPLWLPTNAYSGIVEQSWKPSTAYAVGDYVTPTWGNSCKYRCTIAGTSAATEPRFRYGFQVTITDGTVTWGNAEATTQPTYVLPKADNGHVYKLTTAGTSSGTEPTWPITAGTTVADGTCVWQETGPSTILRQTPSISQDYGSAPPTSGYFEVGHIRWIQSPEIGRPPAWICTLSGNPGGWAPFAPTLAIVTATTTPYALPGNYVNLLVNMSTPSAVTINLPTQALSHRGQVYTIKDAKGDAATNNITVVATTSTIEGSANKIINTNYGSLKLVTNGVTWYVV